MSHEMSLSNVLTVESMNSAYLQSVGDAVSQILNAASTPASVRMMVQEQIQTAAHNQVQAVDSGVVVSSPSNLSSIQEHFDIAVHSPVTTGASKIDRIKTAAIATIGSEPLMINNQEIVTAGMNRIVSANSVEEATHAVKEVFAEIKTQHTQEFVKNLTGVISNASQKIGFNDVKIDASSSGARIVSTDSSGKVLVNEVVVKDGDISVQSELVGFTDGSCAGKIRQFEDELSKHGVKASRKNVSATNGIPQTPLAKRVMKKKQSGHRRTFKDEGPVVKEKNKNIITITEQ